jgi:UDP-2-acetamido-3-amino-2,3-dideoxy-glucuronate N-acetyltransferase
LPENPAFIHPSAEVEAGAELGAGTRIWRFCHVMAGARIGERSMLGQGCFVASGVRIGAGVRVQNQVSLFEGVELEDEVFVGPSAVFTNVRNPRAFVPRKTEYGRTLIRRGATIGANATILPGITLGMYCFVAAGAVVTRDVADYALVVGAPAVQRGWMSRQGEQLRFEQGLALCTASGERYRLDAGAVRLAPEG